MALASSHEPLTHCSIHEWIIERFEYYRAIVKSNLHWNRPFPTIGDHEEDLTTWRSTVRSIGTRDFFNPFQCYEVPITVVGKTPDDDELYTTSVAAAEHALADLFPRPWSGKPFPFFELPAELRDAIYQYVYSYPKSGVLPTQLVSSVRTPWRFRVLTRSFDEDFSQEAWNEGIRRLRNSGKNPSYDITLLTARTHDIFAPLLACKQFYEEAMPIFFNINRFSFPHPYSLHHSLSLLAPTRQKHITRVSFEYTDEYDTVHALRVLSELQNLRILDIRVEDGTFRMAMGKVRGRGLPRLLSLRGLDEVSLSGDCELVRDKVMKNLVRPRNTPEVSGKRQAERVAEVAAPSRAREKARGC